MNVYNTTWKFTLQLYRVESEMSSQVLVIIPTLCPQYFQGQFK